MKIALPALLAVLAIPSAAFAQDPPPAPVPGPDAPATVVVPRFTVLFAGVSGKVECDEASFPAPILEGSSVKFDSDLDVDDAVPAWIAEIVTFRRVGERYDELGSLSWLEADYEGSSTLGSTETFNGRTFAAGTRVESKVRYRSWGLDYAVVSGDTPLQNTSGSFRMGARYVDMRVQMEGSGGETDERLHLFYFGGGVRGETRWGGWLTGLLQASVYFSFGGYDDYWDMEAEEYGGVIFEGHVGLSGAIGPLLLEGGWRYLSNSSYSDLDSTDKFEENDFIFELSGPYFSASLRF